MSSLNLKHKWKWPTAKRETRPQLCKSSTMFLSHKKNRKENAIGSCDNTWLHCLDSLLGEERENNKKGQEKKKRDVEIKVVGWQREAKILCLERQLCEFLLFSLYGVCWSHIVTGDITFLPCVDGARLPPVAFPEERSKLEIRTT